MTQFHDCKVKGTKQVASLSFQHYFCAHLKIALFIGYDLSVYFISEGDECMRVCICMIRTCANLCSYGILSLIPHPSFQPSSYVHIISLLSIYPSITCLSIHLSNHPSIIYVCIIYPSSIYYLFLHLLSIYYLSLHLLFIISPYMYQSISSVYETTIIRCGATSRRGL